MATDTPTTTSVWLTLHEAAHTLGISVRTLQRRIADGQAVAQGDGRQRRVCIDLPATMTDTGGGVHPSTVSAIVGRLDDTARETRQLAAAIAVGGERWQTEAVVALRSARRAWAIAVAAGLAAAVGVTGWLMSSGEAERGRRDIAAMQARVDEATADARQARQDARTARSLPWWYSGVIRSSSVRSEAPQGSDARHETDSATGDPQASSAIADQPVTGGQ